jgi:hypothetical protein
MRLRCFALAIAGMAASAFVVAPPAAAKEGVEAQLTTRIPLDASAGTQLRIAWRLFSVDDEGRREPFGASGVFVRLLSASGADAEVGLAPAEAHPTGEYEATVTVPEGGIRDVEIVLMGWRSDATGTRRADLIFPITHDPVPKPAPVASPASGQPVPQGGDGGSSGWVSLLVAGVPTAALAVLAAAFAIHRKRRRTATLGYQKRTASS